MVAGLGVCTDTIMVVIISRLRKRVVRVMGGLWTGRRKLRRIVKPLLGFVLGEVLLDVFSHFDSLG